MKIIYYSLKYLNIRIKLLIFFNKFKNQYFYICNLVNFESEIINMFKKTLIY